METDAIRGQKNERQMGHAWAVWSGHKQHAKPYILRK
jgi:hypothetical protein